MQRTARQPVTVTSNIERVAAAHADFLRFPKYAVGDLLVPSDAVRGTSAEPGPYDYAMVVETCESLQKRTGDVSEGEGQGVHVVFVTRDGILAHTWAPSWHYRPAMRSDLTTRGLNA